MSEKNERLESLKEAAEREVRRGNFKAALSLYESLSAEEPDNAVLRERMKDLGELLQPMELMHPKTAAEPTPSDISRLHEAEAAVNRGEIAGAIDEYRALLRQSPENALIRERLEELEKLAEDPLMLSTMPRSHGASQPAVPKCQAPRDPGMPARFQSCSTGGAGNTQELGLPAMAGELGLPQDPIACLEELLQRVRRGRRT